MLSLQLRASRQSMCQELGAEETGLCPPLLMQRFWPIISDSPKTSSTLFSASMMLLSNSNQSQLGHRAGSLMLNSGASAASSHGEKLFFSR